jgi:hypothetical protein
LVAQAAEPRIVVAAWLALLVLVLIVSLTRGPGRSSSVVIGQRWSAFDRLATAWDGLLTA